MSQYARVDYHINNLKVGKTRRPKGSRNKIKDQNRKARSAIQLVGSTILQSSQMLATKAGNYTGNKIKKENIKAVSKVGSYALAIAVNVYAGVAYTLLDITNTVVDYNINSINSIQESNYKNSYLGNPTTSNSRWRGNYK